MNAELTKIIAMGRQAVVSRDWARVAAAGREIRQRLPDNPEGYFLLGLAEKAAHRPDRAIKHFGRVLQQDPARYDAAVELAGQHLLVNQFADARALLDRYVPMLSSSAGYLDMAARSYTRMSLHAAAWPLHKRACELRPEVGVFQANMAGCAVYLGKLKEARSIYRTLLQKNPQHQRNHYELAQLQRAEDDSHVNEMLAVLTQADPDPAKNIFIYYALGKELEDLERWDAAFDYYKKGGDAARSTFDYDVATDIEVIDAIINTCSADWLADCPSREGTEKTPIFIVGLPRTGTTLTDRILSSHSQVESVGETQLLQMVLRRESGVSRRGDLTAAIIEGAARRSAAEIARAYVDAIAYRLNDYPFFVEKFPENFLFLGFVAKAWPNAGIVHLRRHPMDACFAMYKQSFFRFAYSLDDLARYYLAYDRLSRHWRDVLGDRLTEIHYENLVTDQESQTRFLLDRLGLEFEEACLHFESNPGSVATASSAQVREKVHSRSVGKWKQFEMQLQTLYEKLVAGGIEL